MAKHLTELGENITLLHDVPEGFEGDADFDRNCGYPVVRFSSKIGTGGWYRDLWARRQLLTTLFREATKADAEYIVFNNMVGSPLFDASVVLATRYLRLPMFVFSHSSVGFPTPRPWLGSLIFKAVLRSAAGVVLVARCAAPYLDKYNLKPERIHVIHSGIDLRESDRYLAKRTSETFPELDTALPVGGANILCVARLAPEKRIDRLIRVMPIIQAKVPRARLAIAGTGNEGGGLRRMIEDSPSRESISLLGQVTGHKKFECYARCTVFALASSFEAFSLVLLEAAAFGKPVVATSVGGTPEAVVDSETGLLVEPDDDQALADAIIRLLSDRAEGCRMGENGRSRVESRFTWTRSAGELRSIVHQAIGNRN